MGKVMKIDDGYKDGKQTLEEAMKLLNVLFTIEECLQPYSEAIKKNPELTRMNYVRQTTYVLMKLCKLQFSVNFPHLQTHYINSDGIEHAVSRLSSAISELEYLISELESKDYIVQSNDSREHLMATVHKIICDLLLYITAQFRLSGVETGTEYLPAYLYCESADITYFDLSKKIQSLCDKYGAEFYVYEVPEGDLFMSSYQSIYQQAEELHYPLTISKANEVLENPETASDLLDDIEKFANNIEVKSNCVSKKEVLSRMEFK